ncbi:MAG: MmgE/PrpD family protein [Actinobacteria bacterium]|nr:MmgE/PrpD family protein [Actinomycetota bacterium]
MSLVADSQGSSHILEELTDLSTLVSTPESLIRLNVLLTDYLACLVGSVNSGHEMKNVLVDEGLIGKCSWLALAVNGNDQDDIDWTVGAHPGSIVWSIAVGLSMKDEIKRENFILAALAGYRTFATVAGVLGASHRSKWHITATAGAFASATTSAVLLGYSPDEHLRALHLAGANIGGTVLAPRDRSGAGGFNRAAAAGLGLTATLAVRSGAQHVIELWDGPLGVLELFDSAGDFSKRDSLSDGVSTTSLRLFPVTGFAQAAVLAAANLSLRSIGELRRLDLGVSGGAISFLDGTRGGDWWDARSAVASAWVSKDPTELLRTKDFEALRRLVHLSSIEIPIGGASLIATTDAGEDREVISAAPGRNFKDPVEGHWRNAKWRRLAGKKAEAVKEISTNLVMDKSAEPMWRSLQEILHH